MVTAMIRLQVLGGGRMGEALLAGVVGSGWCRPEDICVVEKVAQRRADLAAAHPGLGLSEVPVAAEGTVIAVKPGDVAEVVRAVTAANGGRLLSIAAGVTIASLEAAAGPEVAVVRAMPNTPALVGAGAAAIAPGSNASDTDLDWAEALLSSVGSVVRVDESLLDAVTGLSGSGPAYVFLFAEAMIDAGVLAGLPRDVAVPLAVQTLLGSARLLAMSSDGPEALRAAVTSPGGTTAEGVRVLEQRGVRAAVLDAVVAARDRSRELGS
jgi:pyrroline-5-carboxylate reductase